MKEQIQYTILYRTTLEPVMATHQDDSENPISGTIGSVLSQAADWADLAEWDFIDQVLSDNSEYIIVRQEIVSHKLSKDELVILEQEGKEPG